MRHIDSHLTWFLGVVFAVFFVGPGASHVYNIVSAEQPSAFLTRTTANWYVPLVGVLLVCGLALISRDAKTKFRRESQYALVRPVSKLCPFDLGFETVQPGHHPDPHHRPYYDLYIPRTLTPQSSEYLANRRPSYDEARIEQALIEQRSVIIVGSPLQGKTRSLYELLKRLHNYHIIIPIRDKAAPDDDAFLCVKNKNVILLLDDLESYVGAVLDLPAFCRGLNEFAASWVVAASCRDGPELTAVEHDASLGRFYEDIDLKLVLEPPTENEKSDLALGIGVSWNRDSSDLFPTLGAIVMGPPLQAMRRRYRALSSDGQRVLRAIKLLAYGGIIPITINRVQAVADGQTSSSVDLNSALNNLADEAFIRRPGDQDSIRPEPAYLIAAVPGVK